MKLVKMKLTYNLRMDLSTCRQLFSFLLIWLMLFTSPGWTARPSNCLAANHTCHLDTQCTHLLRLMPNVCGSSVKLRCSARQIDHCRSVLRELIETDYMKDCNCPRDLKRLSDCEMFQEHIFNHPCGEIYQSGKGQLNVREKDGSEQEEADKKDDVDDAEAFTPEKRTRNAGPSCIALRKECLSDSECGRDLRSFGNFCKVRRGRCYAESREHCIQAYENLRPYGLFKCSCASHSGHLLRRCSGLLKRYLKNACLLVANEVAKVGKEDNQLPQKADAIKPEEDAIIEISTTMQPTEAADTIEHYKFHSVECYDAYADCKKDYLCGRKMDKFIASCRWNVQLKACDKKKCLPDMAEFYRNVAVKLAHAAAFCVCRQGGVQCESLRGVLQPRCAATEAPVPSCVSLARKCQSSADCRRRWEYYNRYCHTNPETGQCSYGNHACRDAVVGLMGTLMMTNCSCDGVTSDPQLRCQAVVNKLRNKCRTKATMPNPFVYEGTPASHLLKDDKDLVKFEVELPPIPSKKSICARKLQTEKSPVLRLYTNNTDCSDLCKCLNNDTLDCQRFTCLPKMDCTDSVNIFGHGSVFSRNNRGTCLCTNGEIICAKSKQPTNTGNGIFLQVGYSQLDRENLEKLTDFDIKFNYEVLNNKMANLLEFGSGVKCHTNIISKPPGNIVFQVIPVTTSATPQQLKDCILATKILKFRIDSRHQSVTTDPLLSTIRVATIEVIQYYRAGNNNHYQSKININNTNSATKRTFSELTLMNVCVFLTVRICDFLKRRLPT